MHSELLFFGILNLGFDHVQDLARAKKASLEPQDEDMGKALRGNVDPNHWQERILNGQIYHAFLVCLLPLQLEDSGKACFFEGRWETVATWHVTPMQNPFQARFQCDGSHGILTA